MPTNNNFNFIRETQPQDILDVMQENILKGLLDSYYYPLGKSSVVFFPPAGEKTVEAEEINFCESCRKYRNFDDRCENACKDFDRSIASKYFPG